MNTLLPTPGMCFLPPLACLQPPPNVTDLYSFGVVAVLLELVPIASIFFAFTNTVGAALWASDLERSQQTTAPKLKDDAAKAE